MLVQTSDANVRKELPSLSNAELWQLFGERDVHIHSAQALVAKFDVFLHSNGRLFFRMKPDVTIHGDTMGMFPLRADYGDKIHVMTTHRRRPDGSLADLDDYFEISHSIELSELADALRVVL